MKPCLIADIRLDVMSVAMSTHTSIVANGMDRICDDFSLRIADHGFKRKTKRAWTRQRGQYAETIYIQRHGGSYGAPRTPSVDLRVMIGLNAPDGSPLGYEHSFSSDRARRPMAMPIIIASTPRLGARMNGA